MKILIVEDGIEMANGAQMVLKFHGYDADIALLPSEAKAAMKNCNYDAIFMDFGLPEMNGLALTRLLRDEGYTGLIIGLTANAEKYSIEKMTAAGLNGCIAKPLRPEKLVLLDMDPSDTDFRLEFD